MFTSNFHVTVHPAIIQRKLYPVDRPCDLCMRQTSAGVNRNSVVISTMLSSGEYISRVICQDCTHWSSSDGFWTAGQLAERCGGIQMGSFRYIDVPSLIPLMNQLEGYPDFSSDFPIRMGDPWMDLCLGGKDLVEAYLCGDYIDEIELPF